MRRAGALPQDLCKPMVRRCLGRIHAPADGEDPSQRSGAPQHVARAPPPAAMPAAKDAGGHRDEAAYRARGEREHDDPDNPPDPRRPKDDFDRMRHSHRLRWFHTIWRCRSSAASARKKTTMRKTS